MSSILTKSLHCTKTFRCAYRCNFSFPSRRQFPLSTTSFSTTRKMSSSNGITFLPLGALLQTLPIGRKNTNIVLGFPAQEDYEKHNDPHFGLNIGRYANRIVNGKIEDLEGKSYTLEQNNATNCLHGGTKGWGRVIWDGEFNTLLNTVWRDIDEE